CTNKGRDKVIFESCPVGYPQGRGVLLLLKSMKYKPCEPISGDYDYEVHELTSGVFRLHKVCCLGRESLAPQGSCYEVLHGRSARCDVCPLAALGSEPSVMVRARDEREYEVATATRMATNVAVVSVRRLPRGSFAALLRAKLEELAGKAQLSPRERDVFAYLVEGCTLEEIATQLDISLRTVKFHQTNLLAKLGADSRSDLLRLIF